MSILPAPTQHQHRRLPYDPSIHRRPIQQAPAAIRPSHRTLSSADRMSPRAVRPDDNPVIYRLSFPPNKHVSDRPTRSHNHTYLFCRLDRSTAVGSDRIGSDRTCFRTTATGMNEICARGEGRMMAAPTVAGRPGRPIRSRPGVGVGPVHGTRSGSGLRWTGAQAHGVRRSLSHRCMPR
jgi:hypothetical protein